MRIDRRLFRSIMGCSSHRCISFRWGFRPVCPICFCFHLVPAWAWRRPEPWHFPLWGCDEVRILWCCKVRRLPAVYCRPECLWLERRRLQSSGRSRPRRAAAAAAATAAGFAAGDGGDAEGCPGPDAHRRRAPWWRRWGTRGQFPRCLSPSMATGLPGSWNPLSCCRWGGNLRSWARGYQSLRRWIKSCLSQNSTRWMLPC